MDIKETGELCYTYTNYKNGSNAFYDDFRHMTSILRQRKQRCRRKYLRTMNYSYIDQLNAGIQRKKRRRTKMKEKKQVTPCFQHERYFIHSRLDNGNTVSLSSPTSCLKIAIPKSEAQISVTTNTKNINLIPVYLKSLNGTIKVTYLSVESMDVLMSYIEKIERVSKKEIMILLYGRVINSSILSKIKPYDSLGIGIRGKGGMLDEFITKQSTEKDVRDWLIKEVGLTEDDIAKYPKFEYLDGQTILSYEKSTTSDLKSELTIPYGMAKKILLYLNQRSSNHLKNLFQIEMAKWTVTEVQDFIRKSVTVQSNDINEICRVIADEQIDGLVFLSYKDAKELQLEVPGSKELGVIYRRIILKRDEILDNNRLLQSKPIQKEQVLQVTAKDKNPLAFQTPIKKPAYLLPKEWDSYIRNVLQLDICETKSKNKTCSLTIIHSDWKDRNVFEKKMLFCILTDCPDGQENCLDKKHGSFLWNKIRKHTHTWLDHFTEEDKTMFKISRQREDSVFLNNKAITLSKGHVKMRYILESNVEALGQSDYVFLLINKNILLKDTDCYCTYLENPGKKKAIELFFTLKPGFKYWTYVPDDSSFDFVLECIPSELCGQRPVDDKIPEALQSSGQSLAENSLFGSAVINRESSIEMTGDEIIPEQTNIDQQNAEQISVTKANQEDEKVQGTKSSSHNIQIPRRFKDESSEIQYTEGKRVSTAEHNGSVSYRCYEYKFVPENLISKGSDAVCLSINKETIKFACGCMNSRKNGTIMFGIGDSTPDGKSKYKHGEIVGVPLNSVQGDIRRILTESLRTAILRCFESFVSQTADKCISNPVFVPVISRLPCSQAYVIEIDIEPSSVFCKEIYFRINRNNITNSSNIEKENTLYVREGVGTYSKTKQQEKLFLQTELKDIIRKREEDEKQMARQEMYESPETPMDKLRRIISRGSNMLDNSVWPILCFNKPTGEQKRSEHWIQCLKFIKVINFHAVFDFDDESNKDGLCAAHRNEERSILQDEEIFFDLAGSKLDLASKLGIPDENKTVWIFCNEEKILNRVNRAKIPKIGQ